ncbi:MAG: pseudouridine synthase [Bacteroidales bacterium]|nr:pseudouridine synthase [Bacteroidales bacterium]
MENNEKQFESRGGRKPFGGRGSDRTRRDWNSRERSFNRERKPFRRDEGDDFERPRFSKPRNFEGENREFKPRRFNDDKPRRRFDDEKRFDRFNSDERKPRRFNSDSEERREFKPRRFDDRPRRSFDGDFQPRRFDSEERRGYRKFDNENGERKDFRPRRFQDSKPRKFVKNYENPTDYTSIEKSIISRNFDDEWNDEEMVVMDSVPQEPEIEIKRPATEAEGYRLNRFISQAGVCSRRAADDLIAAGKIMVNGKKITDFSTKVFPGDEVVMDGKKLTSQRRVYVVFNKPKDCISTKSDDMGRRTIFDYVKTDVEVKNVGRLDRDTTGVMLLTNDGDLIERLTHPRYNKMKIYHVFLNKNLSPEDFEAIRDNGVDLDAVVTEDGTEIKGGHIDVDDIQYVDGERNQVGIQIHSGLYHVVRRIFEKYGYQVEKLDRVYFAGLTKKDLPRGHWRYLTQKEVAILKRGAYA